MHTEVVLACSRPDQNGVVRTPLFIAHALGDIRVLEQVPTLVDDDVKWKTSLEIPVVDKMLLGGLDCSGFDGLRACRPPRN
jgi:hypothetical protein